MVFTLTRVQCLTQEFGRIFAQLCVKKELTGYRLLGFKIYSATTRVTGSVRHVNTTWALCGKIRGVQKKKELSEKKLTRHFVDQRNVKLIAGAGGKGACTFHSEPRKEWGGPDGGNGGNGGNVIIKGKTLYLV